MQFYIDDDRLNQMANCINEMPTKYGFQLAILLNMWRAEALNAAQASTNTPAPADAVPDSEG